MRQIKFRQPFYKKDKFAGFTYWGFIDSGFAGITTGTNTTIQQAQEQSEQFTGLLDKNGKEIYEGDIIYSEDHSNPKTFVVSFVEGGFCATHPDLNGYPIHINHFYPSIGCRIKVIGNIHENGELL